MAKKIIGQLKLQVKAGQANPSPPVGPALGQRGLNIMAFVKEFNAKTADLEPGAPTPVVITYYQDKSFSLELKTAPATASAWIVSRPSRLTARATESTRAGSPKKEEFTSRSTSALVGTSSSMTATTSWRLHSGSEAMASMRS